MVNSSLKGSRSTPDKKFRVLLFLLGFLSVGTRFIMLGTVPPANPDYLWLRYVTATASIISIFVLVAIVNKISGSKKIGLVTGTVFALMPWHIEQSRIYSPILLSLLVLLFSLYLCTCFKQFWVRSCSILCSLVFMYFLDSLFWLSALKLSLQMPHLMLSNLFKVYSINFLFYKNDSFWWGGLRDQGTMLPSMLPLFILGLTIFLKNLQKKHLLHIVAVVIITSIAILNPLFPEQRELFLLSPYLALIMSYGIIKLFEYYNYSLSVFKILIIVYLSFISYDYILFFHQYTYHYPLRINSEIPVLKRDF